jgi:uncharacterized protein
VQLDGAHVLVTGASRGIGEAFARRFAAAGARVTLVARSRDAIERLAAELGGGAVPADLLDPDSVDGLVDEVERQAGPVDVLVNNAGLETTAPHVSQDPAVLRDTLRLNLEAPMVLTRSVLPGMLERGRGHLVYVSSIAGSAGVPYMAVYSASKGGVNNFVAALRLELRDTPIGTTLVAPGPVDTAMWGGVEDAEEISGVLRRFNRLHLIPKKSPDLIARRTVEAVRSDARHVRTPRRLSAMFWLGEGPRRLTETILTGVHLPSGHGGHHRRG